MPVNDHASGAAAIAAGYTRIQTAIAECVARGTR
jgi:hypothetical protein